MNTVLCEGYLTAVVSIDKKKPKDNEMSEKEWEEREKNKNRERGKLIKDEKK
jgi:hypothetical protein